MPVSLCICVRVPIHECIVASWLSGLAGGGGAGKTAGKDLLVDKATYPKARGRRRRARTKTVFARRQDAQARARRAHRGSRLRTRKC